MPTGERGGQRKYSDPCVELGLTLKLLFGLPWRSVEGLLGSLFHFVGIEAPIPDHTTLSRRTRRLDVPLQRPLTREPVHLVVDATGLSIFGQGQWAAAKWGARGRRGWRKLHVATDQRGNILAVELTDASVGDATALPGLLDKVADPVERLTVDGGYDRHEVYEAARKRGATTVIPPRRDAVVSGELVLCDRDAHIERIGEVGRRCWRLEAGQHHQSRAENTFYRYKKRFGGRLTARNEPAQRNEVLTACNILNRMTELGMPNSIALRG
ncbi:MAG: IS5 family transposase [Candidatus Latescibacterota bacterium]|nr:IS5 family transposase [Candidatus Latescibacterota bacterium]